MRQLKFWLLKQLSQGHPARVWAQSRVLPPTNFVQDVFAFEKPAWCEGRDWLSQQRDWNSQVPPPPLLQMIDLGQIASYTF